jgi:hypothetical protein
MSALQAFRERLRLVVELGEFIVRGKRWWLAPLLLAFAVLALVVAVAEIPIVAPFIYALF